MKTPLYSLVFTVVLGLSPASYGNAMRESVYNALETVKAQIQDGQYAPASKQLGEMGQQNNLTTYERSQVLNLHGYLAIQQHDYQAAIRHYQSIMGLEEVPEGLHQSARRNLAQLHYQNGDWQQALNALSEMAPSDVRNDSQLAMLQAHSLYQLERYREAATSLKGLSDTDASEQALNLLRACYQQLDDHNSAIGVLETLAERFPKTQYLKALASLYGLQENYKHQLALMESLYSDQRLESEAEWRTLISLHLHQGQPRKAALRLQEAISLGVMPASDKNRFKLVQAWIQAHEPDQALSILEDLSSQTRNGESELMAGRLLLQSQQWNRAARWLQKAVAKSGADNPETLLLLGIAEMRSGNHPNARDVLTRATRHPNTQERASQWLNYMNQLMATDATVLASHSSTRSLKEDKR